MNAWRFLIQSLRHYARSHAGAFLGATVASAILIGALVVGDSVRGSLFEMAMSRLGRIDTVITGNDRLFRDALSNEMTGEGFADVVPAIQLPAVASASGGAARANQTQIIGVTSEFWNLGLKPNPAVHPNPDEATLSQALARQLKIKEGDPLILRIQKPSRISPDAPLAPDENTSIALRLTVAHIVDDASMGRFSLQASQLPALNAFVDLTFLQTELEIPGKANLLLCAQEKDSTIPASDGTAALTNLAKHWTLEDSQLMWVDLNQLEGQGMELRTERVFMDQFSAEASGKTSTDSTGLLTYFVNTITKGDRLTPYSMVTATESPYVPDDLKENEIIINEWLAEDLDAKPGDTLAMTYYEVGLGRDLKEATSEFTVREVVPMQAPYNDPYFMPDFPGLKDADNCRDWDTGFPIDLDLIRDQDNEYWETHKGTPKAFISLTKGKEIWENRFGSLTAVRYPEIKTPDQQQELESAILKNLEPSKLGIMSIPVKMHAWNSVVKSQDFGGLFIGFSFFLILAALILMNLLFQFVVEQRTREAGILMAVGMTPKRLKQFLLREGMLISLLGHIAGVGLAVLYAKGMLYGLSTIWSDAVGTSSLQFHLNPPTIVGGLIGSIAMTGMTLWWGLRKQIQKSAHVLLTESQVEGQATDNTSQGATGRFMAGIACGLAAMGIAAIGMYGNPANATGAFFGAGSLLLIAGLTLASAYLRKATDKATSQSPSLFEWGIRNASRRRKRSLATISMLAFGSFLVIAVGANKLDALRDADKRSSGTGGFAFWGESTAPIVRNLNSPEGMEAYGLFQDELEGVSFVPFKRRDGEEASCLNLNRAQRPQLLGVNPEALASRDAFTFAQVEGDVPEGSSAWSILSNIEPDGTIPGIADFNSIMWAMGKSVGDVLVFQNTQGETFRVRLVAAVANSILQGNVIISESAFIKQYPNEPGYKTFLLDVPAENREGVASALTRALEDDGLSLSDAVERMKAFNAVQNTYLSTFQLLGGLGMVLGSFGLGVVVLRNLLDRRTELGLLAAVGFTRKRIRALVLLEHLGLLCSGLLIGTISAWIAVVPSLQSPGADIPYTSLAWTLLAIFGTGFIWTLIATQSALKGKFLDLLRDQ
jgi:putative ABC transport system permease protein